MKLRWQVHGNEKERFMVNQRNRNIRAIQDDDRMVPIKPDIVSLFDSQSRQSDACHESECSLPRISESKISIGKSYSICSLRGLKVSSAKGKKD